MLFMSQGIMFDDSCLGLTNLDVSDGRKEIPVTRHLQSYHHFYFLMYISYIRKYCDGEKKN
jgi:hypothetical protein